MENTTHYACQGTCAGVSQEEGVCSAEDCTKAGEALAECNCTDTGHSSEEVSA